MVILYSHLILNALHSTENSGSLNIKNISQQLDWLNDELHQIAENASRDNKNVKQTVDNIGKSMGNGLKTQEILTRLGEVTRRGDQLLLEQIQTDRRINLKLEVLENSINILKTQIEADKMSKSQTKLENPHQLEQQIQFEERNRQLETKLQHLEMILAKNSNLEPDQLRKEIEDDSQLAPKGEEEKSVREKAIELWNKMTNSDKITSSGSEISAKCFYIIAGTVTTFVIQIYQFSSVR